MIPNNSQEEKRQRIKADRKSHKPIKSSNSVVKWKMHETRRKRPRKICREVDKNISQQTLYKVSRMRRSNCPAPDFEITAKGSILNKQT